MWLARSVPSEGDPEEGAPPWLGFRTIRNSSSSSDSDDDNDFTSSMFGPLRSWHQNAESSDEDDDSDSDDNGHLTGEEDDRANVARIMLGLSENIQHQVRGPAQTAVDVGDKEDDKADAPLSPWNNKCKAKLQIWKELDDPLSAIHFMDVQQIHKKWAHRYPLRRFKVNFNNMKNQKRPGEKKQNQISQKPKTEPWMDGKKMSKACALLFKLFMDRTSGVQNMDKKKIWKSHQCFQNYPFDDFERYVDAIKEKTDARKMLIQEEEENFRAYAIANPRRELSDRNIPFWDTHSGRRLLEEDNAAGTANSTVSKPYVFQLRD